MSWHLVDREDVRTGDTIRIVVPNVLAVEEGADGRPAFGYGAGDVYVERFTPDEQADAVGAALAGAGIGDLRRGIPLEDWKAEAGAGGIRISGRLPEGVQLTNLEDFSVLHPNGGRVPDVDEVTLGADGTPLWRRVVTPAGAEVVTAEGDLPRCPVVDPDEGVCLWTPHGDDVDHWFSMFGTSPQVPPAAEHRA